MSSYVVGVDVGQRVDPTAIVALETWRPAPAFVDDRPSLQHRIVWMARLPLGTFYQDIVEQVARVAEAARERGQTTIVLDATGVGRPVVDMLRARTGIALRNITFTAGEKAVQDGPFDWHVPKTELVTALAVVLESYRILPADDCPLVADLQAELSTFDRRISGSGHTTYDASSGNHDDLVAAAALACWWAERPNVGQGYMEFLRLTAERR
jgi:hypothetical protein